MIIFLGVVLSFVINTQELINPRHTEFFQSTEPQVIFYGGSDSGKSHSAVDKLALQVIIHDINNHIPVKILVVRKSMPSLKKTCLELIEERFTALGVHYKVNRSDMIMHCGNRSKIFFVSIMNKIEIEKLKSLTNVDFVWIEEANELIELAYDELDRRVRGGNASFHQIVLTFNPISINNWIYRRFFERNIGNAQKICVNIDSNPWADQWRIDKLDALKEYNINQYKVYRLGQWGRLQGAIYTNWIEDNEFPRRTGDDTFYGLDFGFNNPSALVMVKIIDKIYYISQRLYKSKMTNSDLITTINSMNLKDRIVYCDSAEPARIEELRRAGINAKPANKQVKDGIDYLQSQEIHYDAHSSELIKEKDGYCWKENREGKPMDDPVKLHDHLMDATRYAIYTHYCEYGQGLSGGAFAQSGTFEEPEVW